MIINPAQYYEYVWSHTNTDISTVLSNFTWTPEKVVQTYRILTQMVCNNVSYRLSVCSGPRPTAVDVVSNPGQLVRDPVSDVRPGCGARIGADHYASVELAGHDRGSCAVWSAQPLRHAWVGVSVYN